MYNNIGKKIMILSKIIGWLLLAAGVIVCFILLSNDINSGWDRPVRAKDNIYGWIALATGIAGFISSWFICGFGQLVDDVHTICEKTTSENITNQ